MNLRKPNLIDAPYMLEWMHDKDVVEHMQSNFALKTIEDCKNFITSSQVDDSDVHRSIVDDNDQYMGTVSLKHINYINKTAEFAITIRKCAMGKGYSQFAMCEIIRIGLQDLGLEKIIWCVSKENIRANKFYQKMGYSYLENIPSEFKNSYINWINMNWFVAEQI